MLNIYLQIQLEYASGKIQGLATSCLQILHKTTVQRLNGQSVICPQADFTLEVIQITGVQNSQNPKYIVCIDQCYRCSFPQVNRKREENTPLKYLEYLLGLFIYKNPRLYLSQPCVCVCGVPLPRLRVKIIQQEQQSKNTDLCSAWWMLWSTPPCQWWLQAVGMGAKGRWARCTMAGSCNSLWEPEPPRARLACRMPCAYTTHQAIQAPSPPCPVIGRSLALGSPFLNGLLGRLCGQFRHLKRQLAIPTVAGFYPRNLDWLVYLVGSAENNKETI